MKKQYALTGILAATLVAGAVVADDQSARERAEVIIPDGWQQVYERWQFAPAVKIDNRVYVSGVVASPIEGDLAAGYRRAWRQIEGMLYQAGANLDDIVEMTTFHTDIAGHLPSFAEVKKEFIKAPYPSWTAIGTTGLAVPEGVVEIKVIAHLKKS